MSINTNDIPFYARCIRIGTVTLDAYSKLGEKTNDDVIIVEFTPRGIKFTATIRRDPTNSITFKIPIASILKVETFLQRACPVLWISTDTTCAANLRSLCRVEESNGASYDPESTDYAERHISIISSIDSLAFTLVSNIKTYFTKVAKHNKMKPDAFITTINQPENHSRLLKVADAINSLDKRPSSSIGSKNSSNLIGKVNTSTTAKSLLKNKPTQ
uniref:Uncharacterized protein n=1 Tax=Ciona savignyi TaxID=51511 RepID=H2YH33_CIOSA